MRNIQSNSLRKLVVLTSRRGDVRGLPLKDFPWPKRWWLVCPSASFVLQSLAVSALVTARGKWNVRISLSTSSMDTSCRYPMTTRYMGLRQLTLFESAGSTKVCLNKRDDLYALSMYCQDISIWSQPSDLVSVTTYCLHLCL